MMLVNFELYKRSERVEVILIKHLVEAQQLAGFRVSNFRDFSFNFH